MIFHYTSELKIDAPLEEVFQFFSRADNLEKITPAWLRFKILTPLPIKMKVGTLINYRLSLYHLPLRWQTEIKVWEPPHRFVDIQRRGPYKEWIHEHAFTAVEGGCLVKDKVRYQVYGWILSPLIDRSFVRKDIEKIFNYRRQAIERIFSTISY